MSRSKRIIILPVLAVLLSLAAAPRRDIFLLSQTPEASRFEAVDIYLDSGDEGLAAWQLELIDRSGASRIAGVEGGEPAAFKSPPYYDPAALKANRIILAAFSTSTELPKGKTRIATVHLEVRGGKTPEFEVQIEAAATSDGKKISVTASLGKEERK